MKLCSGCQEIFPVASFASDQHSPDGVHGQCKNCRNEKSKKRRSEPEEKLKHRHQTLRWQYGITRSEYERMLKQQGGKCRICGKAPGKTSPKDQHLYVDHCHKTGHIRGLLCFYCNFALGNYRDSIANHLMGIFHLLEHGKLPTVS